MRRRSSVDCAGHLLTVLPSLLPSAFKPEAWQQLAGGREAHPRFAERICVCILEGCQHSLARIGAGIPAGMHLILSTVTGGALRDPRLMA